jgi:hypothetical protein
VSGHQDRARHEETAIRTWACPHHRIPQNNPIDGPRRLLRRAKLWQNETFCFHLRGSKVRQFACGIRLGFVEAPEWSFIPDRV